MRTVVAVIPIAVGALLITGCGGQEASSPSVTETVRVTETVTTTVTPTPSDPSGEVVPPSAEAPDPPIETVGSTVVNPAKKGIALGLVDFFNPSDAWTEDRVDVASKKSLRGLISRLDGCWDEMETLELRLANSFEEIKLTAGQANTSETANQILTVEITADGRQVEIQRIAWNKTKTLSLPVKQVNSLNINVYLDDEVDDCMSADVTSVLTDVILT